MPAKKETLVEVDGRQLALTNLDKVLYPAIGTTKRDTIEYLTAVADVMLPHLAGRPVTRKRWPNGWNAFRWTILRPLGRHAAGSPDRVVFDLDPGPGDGLAECVEVAFLRKELLDALADRIVPVTSGSKGMHLYVPLPDPITSEDASGWARQVAEEMQKALPRLVAWRMTKPLREGKVLFDWSRNAAAKTTIAPYSMRGREHPMVAAARTWDELAGDLAHWTTGR